MDNEQHRMPRWVRTLVVVAVVVAVGFLVAMLASDGRHGPGWHSPRGAATPGGR